MAKVQKQKYEAKLVDYSMARARDCYEVTISLSTNLQDAPIQFEYTIVDLDDLDKLLELMNKYSN